MVKKLLVISALTTIGMLIVMLGGGCSKEVLEPIAQPWFTPSRIATTGFPMYPVKVVIGNAHKKALIDTLVKTEISKKYPDYISEKGKPIGINLHNPTDETVTFFLSYEVAVKITQDKDTGLFYLPAPAGCEDWVEFSTKIINVPPKTIGHVPVRIVIPKKVMELLPLRWEFRIRVKDSSQTGMLGTEVLQRWLISMKD